MFLPGDLGWRSRCAQLPQRGGHSTLVIEGACTSFCLIPFLPRQGHLTPSPPAACHLLARLQVGAVQQHPEDSRLTTAWNESLYLGILPSYSFANAHTYIVQRLHEVWAGWAGGCNLLKCCLRRVEL